MAEQCSFSNQRIDSPNARAYERAQCPVCLAIRQLQWRATGIIFDFHPPAQRPRAFGTYWQRVDGQWVLQSSNGSTERK